jgi:glycerol-3-phosphate acyltransferase PlsY
MDAVMVLVGKLFASYVLGSVVGSLALGKLKGVDIRTVGSGNAGATNALRTQGTAFAAGTAIIDVGKGVLAALLIGPMAWSADSGLSLPATQLACGLSAALGHCFPVFHGFRGGKGAGTLFGAVIVLFPWPALMVLGLWLLVLTTTGYVGLGTVIAGLGFPAVLALMGVPLASDRMALAIACALFLTWTHRSNLARLRAGTEHRFEKARVWARCGARRSG